MLPMFHVYGLTMCLTMNMLAAGTLVLLPTFDLGLLFKAIDKWKPTVFPGVPPMYDQIVRSRRTSRHDLRSIRTCVSGAMRLPPETVGKFEQVTGGRLVEGYGLTESSPVALANPLNDNARPGTIGVPVPGTDVRIADLDDPARDVPFGRRRRVVRARAAGLRRLLAPAGRHRRRCCTTAGCTPATSRSWTQRRVRHDRRPQA